MPPNICCCCFQFVSFVLFFVQCRVNKTSLSFGGRPSYDLKSDLRRDQARFLCKLSAHILRMEKSHQISDEKVVSFNGESIQLKQVNTAAKGTHKSSHFKRRSLRKKATDTCLIYTKTTVYHFKEQNDVNVLTVT